MKSSTFKFSIFLSGVLVLFLLLTNEVIATAPEVHGRVLRQDTNAPIPDVWVRWSDLEPPARSQNEHGVRFTKTNTNGEFTFCSWQKSATCADVASCNNNVMIDTDWNSSNESRLAQTSDGYCSSGFGCSENSHKFTAVVPAGWLGLFTTVSGYDLHIDQMNNVEQPVDIGIFYYVPPTPTATPTITPTATPMPTLTPSPTPICGY
ncbi:hypothetical protein COV53_01635 [Candidatus Gottesmanbacteria bacterium CG11_big_fil_rev_8_21_14_0_20_37_11]|uniref:Uncharacterized protein n=1 Tax=Candidatus Gottesmanbacteria bacterium CG11_big_fil_rev_8_21_14_0_20_37_11 TaxID=1974575 RepID=A0A2H0NIJ3_9BACT|nr:MAG: hypothetical protein COV53_01635 [Candidatus Gottesmanbacteria bacterium CG11_big_fil_rev_8_21_14_0_20_37_11]